MDFSRTCIKRKCAGTSLIDLLVGTALAGIVLAVLGFLALYGGRSFVAMANYVKLDQYSRNALERMSREIRQCNRLSAWSTNSLTFEDSDGKTLLYSYSSASKQLVRTKDGKQDLRPLLENCTFLQFSIFQRNPISGTYDQYPTATPSTCKLVQLSWICSRSILGGQNTESVQSAKVVIRRQ
jgi:hypothetical protein